MFDARLDQLGGVYGTHVPLHELSGCRSPRLSTSAPYFEDTRLRETYSQSLRSAPPLSSARVASSAAAPHTPAVSHDRLPRSSTQTRSPATRATTSVHPAASTARGSHTPSMHTRTHLTDATPKDFNQPPPSPGGPPSWRHPVPGQPAASGSDPTDLVGAINSSMQQVCSAAVCIPRRAAQLLRGSIHAPHSCLPLDCQAISSMQELREVASSPRGSLRRDKAPSRYE